MIQVFDTYSRKETLNNPILIYFEVGFYRPLSTFKDNISHLSMFFFFYILLSTELNKIRVIMPGSQKRIPKNSIFIIIKFDSREQVIEMLEDEDYNTVAAATVADYKTVKLS